GEHPPNGGLRLGNHYIFTVYLRFFFCASSLIACSYLAISSGLSVLGLIVLVLARDFSKTSQLCTVPSPSTGTFLRPSFIQVISLLQNLHLAMTRPLVRRQF